VSMAAFLLSGAVLVGAVSLIPAYIGLSSTLSTYESEQGTVGDDTDRAPIRELGRVAGLLDALNVKLDTEPMTELLDNIVLVRPPGIEIASITFERSPLSFSLRGTASTRDALVAYKRALEDLERVTEVSSPISDLAKSTNLEFTLSVRLVEQQP